MSEPNETPNLEQSPTNPNSLASENEFSTPIDQQSEAYKSELAAFERNMQDKNFQLPEQFKSVEELFNSYKELQRSYTQSRQELSQLKGQEPQAPQKPSEAVQELSTPGELRLGSEQETAQKAAEAQQEAVAASPSVSDEDMKVWRNELATKGELSVETRQEIARKTGFSDEFVDSFAAGQRALMREAFNQAASMVEGGAKGLQEVLSWAKETLSPEEARYVDEALQGPSWRTVLLGLEAGYKKEKTSSKTKEPAKYSIPDAPMPKGALKPFATRAEYYAARNDRRYLSDPKFRDEVESRVMQTNWNSLPMR